MKFRKELIIGVFGLFIISCSENEDSKEIERTEEEVLTETIEEGNDEVISNMYEADESNKWEINDYAEFFLEAKIAENSESLDYEAGDQWYYERLSVEGGYCRITGAIDGVIEFGIWRMDNGHDLIGRTDMGCGPVCDYSYHFYEQNKTEGAEVTESIIPINAIEEHQVIMYEKLIAKFPDLEYPEAQQLRFFMPPHGTSMNVNLVVGADEVEIPLVQLAWDKQKFFIEALHETLPSEMN